MIIYNCEACGCSTEYSIFVKTDEERVLENIKNKNDYTRNLKEYYRNIEKTKWDFEIRIYEHNKSCHWYNLKRKWCLDVSIGDISIMEKSDWINVLIDSEQFFSPSFSPKLEKYVECPICEHRRYVE